MLSPLTRTDSGRCVCAGRPVAGGGGGGGDCQFVFHEPRKCLAFRANVSRLHSFVASVLNLGSAARAHQGHASPFPLCLEPIRAACVACLP